LAQNNLGNAYSDLPAGDRAAHLQKAIAVYEAALRVRTEKDFPIDWAIGENTLGLARSYSTVGDRRGNLQNAKTCFEAALRVWTESDFPEEHRSAVADLNRLKQALRLLSSEYAREMLGAGLDPFSRFR